MIVFAERKVWSILYRNRASSPNCKLTKRNIRTPGIKLGYYLTTKDNRIIEIGDQTGDDRTNRQMDTTIRRINRTNQNTAYNLSNRRITRPMVRQGLDQQ